MQSTCVQMWSMDRKDSVMIDIRSLLTGIVIGIVVTLAFAFLDKHN